MTSPLLAKSAIPWRPPKTLLEHTQDVIDAAEQLFGTATSPTRLGRCWLRFFRLSEDAWPQFFLNLLASCLFHDWGKANDRMQEVFRGQRKEQLFRHEHLSVLLIGYPGVIAWLKQRPDIDWDIVLSAVGSHHLKFSDTSFAVGISNDAVRLKIDHEDFGSLICITAERLGLTGHPQFPQQVYWGFANDSATYNLAELREALQERLAAIKPGPMLHAVRSALIIADAAGSGLPRENYTVRKWVEEQFDEKSDCSVATVDQLIQARIDEIESEGIRFIWNAFQNECEMLPDRALLLAPCGAGKSLAAWRWILGRLKIRGNLGRIIFLYPTRATATEGFNDYVSWAPEAHAALLHGTSSYDLDGMFPSTDRRSQARYDATDPRLFALQYWSKRIFSATIDQFFAFLSYSYGPLCLLPLLADSVIVVDEAHSFDKKMFSGLLGFLQAFDVPVLCMTATLQAGRKKQLEPFMDRIYEDRPKELGAIADAKRYQVKKISAEQAEHEARKAVAFGKRVLWVVNQVNKAQELAEKLSDLPFPVICYHSRFKLDDRIDRHRDTINAIRPGQSAAIAITTQVCEMSLDIDADVLITEECPISSCIQRMGRCRRARKELATKGPGHVFIYQPAREHVYKPDDLVGIHEFIDFLETGSPVSQSDLEWGLQQFGSRKVDAPKLNSFLASGGYADCQEETLRDIEEHSFQAVLRDEVDSFLRAAKSKKDGFIVPVPKKLMPGIDPRLPFYLRAADERHYSPRTGYHDAPIQ